MERVCVGAKHTRTCTIAFLPLQETHYSGTPHTAGPATDVRALLSTTLGALCTEEVRKGDCPLGAPRRTAQARNGRTRPTGRVTSGDNTRTDNKVARRRVRDVESTVPPSPPKARRHRARTRRREHCGHRWAICSRKPLSASRGQGTEIAWRTAHDDLDADGRPTWTGRPEAHPADSNVRCKERAVPLEGWVLGTAQPEQYHVVEGPAPHD